MRVAIVLLFIFSSCIFLGVHGKSLRMAESQEFTNVVRFKLRFFIRLFDKHDCTGALVTLEWIITSGHCANRLNANKAGYRVYVGGRHGWNARIPFLSGGTQFSYIDMIMMITSTNGKYGALVKVTTPFTRTDFVRVAIMSFNQVGNHDQDLMPSWGRFKPFISQVLGLIPGFFFASPWLRVYDTLGDVTESPCPEDSGAPVMRGDEFITLYVGTGTCLIGDRPLNEDGYVDLVDFRAAIENIIPELFTRVGG